MGEARSVYDRLQNDERRKVLEERQREHKESIQEKLKLHDDRCKEILDAKKAEQAAMTSRFETQLDKVTEARKKLMLHQRREQHAKWKEHQEKEKAAEEA